MLTLRGLKAKEDKSPNTYEGSRAVCVSIGSKGFLEVAVQPSGKRVLVPEKTAVKVRIPS